MSLLVIFKLKTMAIDKLNQKTSLAAVRDTTNEIIDSLNNSGGSGTYAAKGGSRTQPFDVSTLKVWTGEDRVTIANGKVFNVNDTTNTQLDLGLNQDSTIKAKGDGTLEAVQIIEDGDYLEDKYMNLASNRLGLNNRILDLALIPEPSTKTVTFNMFGTNAQNRPNIPYLNDGFLMTFNWDSGNYFTQFAIDVDGTALGYRGASNDWKQISTTNMKVCDNLLPGSKLDKQYSTNTVNSWVSYVTYKGYKCLKMTAMPYYSTGTFSFSGFDPLIAGEEYVLSFDCINPNGEDIRLDFTPGINAGGASRPFIEYNLPQSTTWKRYEWRFKVTDPGDLAKYLNIFATGKTGTWTGWFKEFKLERGSTKTGFSQSFKDKADINGDITKDFNAKNITTTGRVTASSNQGKKDQSCKVVCESTYNNNQGLSMFFDRMASGNSVGWLPFGLNIDKSLVAYPDGSLAVLNDSFSNYRVRLWKSANSGYVDVYNAAGTKVLRLDGSNGALEAMEARIDSCAIKYANGLWATRLNTTSGNFNFYVPNNYGSFYFSYNNGNRADVYCKTVHQSSDERSKENIVPYKPNNEIIRTVQFNFKGEKRINTGYIAQEVEKVFPEYVDTDSKGMKSLDYTGIHTAKIARLEQEVKDLKELVKQLINK